LAFGLQDITIDITKTSAIGWQFYVLYGLNVKAKMDRSVAGRRGGAIGAE
jgi:hypothetical protein